MNDKLILLSSILMCLCGAIPFSHTPPLIPHTSLFPHGSAFALWRPGEAPPFPTPNRLLTLFCLGLEPPPDVTVPFNVSAAPGSTATLSCVVTSTVRFNLTWQRGGADVRLGARSRIASNLSLEIQRVTPDDAGWYGCIAANEGGVTASRVYLSVQCKCVLLLLYVSFWEDKSRIRQLNESCTRPWHRLISWSVIRNRCSGLRWNPSD